MWWTTPLFHLLWKKSSSPHCLCKQHTQTKMLKRFYFFSSVEIFISILHFSLGFIYSGYILLFLLLSFLYILKEFSILHLNIELHNFFFWFPKHLFSWLSRWIECTILRYHSSAIVNRSRESLDYWWFQVLGHSMGFKLTSAVGEGCFLKMRREHFVKNYKWEKKKTSFLKTIRPQNPGLFLHWIMLHIFSILSL